MNSISSEKIPIFTLFIIALLLRMSGIMFGDVHPDENFSLSVRVLAGEIIPYSHFYTPLLNYLNAFAYVILYGAGKLTGFWQNAGEFKMQWFQNPLPFYFVGRMVTAVFGALASPLAYLIAKNLSCRKNQSFMVGLIIAIFPIHLLLSHISKSDVPLVTALFLVIYIYLSLERISYGPFWLGAASAAAIGFKQTALFFIAPLAVILSIQLYLSGKSVIKFLAFYLAALIATFIVVSLGVVLDLANFIQFQKVQSQIAVREFSFDAFMEKALPKIASSEQGASLPLLILWFAIPFLYLEKRILTLWTATSLGMISLLLLSGSRVEANIFLPFTITMVLLSSISLTLYLENRNYGRGALALLGAIFLIFLFPALDVLVQSSREPISYKVSKKIEEIAIPHQTKILTSDRGLLNVPTDNAALLEEKKRHRRLAKKYRVQLPEEPLERLLSLQKKLDPSYFVRQIPWAIGGLEVYDESEVKEIVPYAWPIQKQEWDLSYWQDQGYSIFVIKDEEAFLNSKVPYYQQLHRQIREKCALIADIPTNRPLFFESDVKIYRCSGLTR